MFTIWLWLFDELSLSWCFAVPSCLFFLVDCQVLVTRALLKLVPQKLWVFPRNNDLGALPILTDSLRCWYPCPEGDHMSVLIILYCTILYYTVYSVQERLPFLGSPTALRNIAGQQPAGATQKTSSFGKWAHIQLATPETWN